MLSRGLWQEPATFPDEKWAPGSLLLPPHPPPHPPEWGRARSASGSSCPAQALETRWHLLGCSVSRAEAPPPPPKPSLGQAGADFRGVLTPCLPPEHVPPLLHLGPALWGCLRLLTGVGGCEVWALQWDVVLRGSLGYPELQPPGGGQNFWAEPTLGSWSCTSLGPLSVGSSAWALSEEARREPGWGTIQTPDQGAGLWAGAPASLCCQFGLMP